MTSLLCSCTMVCNLLGGNVPVSKSTYYRHQVDEAKRQLDNYLQAEESDNLEEIQPRSMSCSDVDDDNNDDSEDTSDSSCSYSSGTDYESTSDEDESEVKTEVKDATSRRKGLSLHSLLASLYPGSEVTVCDFAFKPCTW